MFYGYDRVRVRWNHDNGDILYLCDYQPKAQWTTESKLAAQLTEAEAKEIAYWLSIENPDDDFIVEEV